MITIILFLILFTVIVALFLVNKNDSKNDSDKPDKKSQKKVTFSSNVKKDYYKDFNDKVENSTLRYISEILPYDLNYPKTYEVPISSIPPFKQPIQDLAFNAEYKSTIKKGCNNM
jgi:hypothetical protein